VPTDNFVGSPHPLLHVEELGRRFGGLDALRDVSIAVTTGSCHAVIGPNGAGKTTLVNLIAGSLRPTSGTVSLDGHDITRYGPAQRARRGVGRTWQHPAIFRRLPVAANVALAITRHSAPTGRRGLAGAPAVTTRCEQVLDQMGLAGHASTVAGSLPYGLRRRLELAVAVAAGPRLLLLDEPSAGLDPAETRRLTAHLRGLAGDVTVLLVDHNLEVIWELADTVTVLHHGQHLATGTPREVRAHPDVRRAYLTTTRGQAPTRTTPTRTTGPVLLRVRDLTASYHGAPVLCDVKLDVAQGETVAVLGRNGAGKTTLLNTIAGLLPAQPPTTIDIIVPKAGQRRVPGLALVPQGRRLFGPLTVAEHLACARAPHRAEHPAASDPLWTRDRVLALLPALAPRLRHRADRLSGGEQQMLALARALLTNPRLLVLDEPSEGLAPALVDQLAAILHELARTGLAVLLAEQNINLARIVADRFLVLADRRIAMTCAAHELTTPTNERQLRALLGVTDPTPDNTGAGRQP
jgi:ABC-type branched-subunit amino acid transport system ATPase component